MLWEYYSAAFPRVFFASIRWFIGQGWKLNLLLAFGVAVCAFIYAAIRSRRASGSWSQAVRASISKPIADFALALLGASAIAFCTLFVWNFINDAPNQILISRKEIPKAQYIEKGTISLKDIKRNAPKIGEPLDNPQEATHLVLELHENAIVIWIEPLNKIIRINNVGNVKTYRSYDDESNSVPNVDGEMLGLPKECLPPTGGIAVLWKRNKQEWKSIGCRTNYCAASGVLYQEFTNGLVIYGVPQFVGAQIGREYLLVKNSPNSNDGSWQAINSPKPIQSCNPL